MSGEETNIANRIMLRASQEGVVLLRNVRGMFLTLDGKRKVRAGLGHNGASDLIGWRTLLITRDMVPPEGLPIAQIVCLEVKTPTGRATDEQINFVFQVRGAGGIGQIVRSPQDALDALEQWPRKPEPVRCEDTSDLFIPNAGD